QMHAVMTYPVGRRGEHLGNVTWLRDRLVRDCAFRKLGVSIAVGGYEGACLGGGHRVRARARELQWMQRARAVDAFAFVLTLALAAAGKSRRASCAHESEEHHEHDPGLDSDAACELVPRRLQADQSLRRADLDR